MKTGFQLTWAAAAALAAFATPALAKDARCDIRTSDGVYAGPCNFTLAEWGSFEIDPTGRPDFFVHAKDEPGIVAIAVDIEGSRAQVRGLTADGVFSRWGVAHRSTTDRACWIGKDFSICVY